MAETVAAAARGVEIGECEGGVEIGVDGTDELVDVAEEAEGEVGGLGSFAGCRACREGWVHGERGGEGEVLGWGSVGGDRGDGGGSWCEEVEEEGEGLDVCGFGKLTVLVNWSGMVVGSGGDVGQMVQSSSSK